MLACTRRARCSAPDLVTPATQLLVAHDCFHRLSRRTAARRQRSTTDYSFTWLVMVRAFTGHPVLPTRLEDLPTGSPLISAINGDVGRICYDSRKSGPCSDGDHPSGCLCSAATAMSTVGEQ
ncbi:unnamed protein product [Cuscuta epithymum]|uniref:Uncharacterized protein n=1 Tax=Cuscuta epithymum TaxID=186058 RepID=A0AAV0DTK1_9ASTE|nr:unnamed protein product [Cuscuta epithymum]